MTKSLSRPITQSSMIAVAALALLVSFCTTPTIPPGDMNDNQLDNDNAVTNDNGSTGNDNGMANDNTVDPECLSNEECEFPQVCTDGACVDSPEPILQLGLSSDDLATYDPLVDAQPVPMYDAQQGGGFVRITLRAFGFAAGAGQYSVNQIAFWDRPDDDDEEMDDLLVDFTQTLTFTDVAALEQIEFPRRVVFLDGPLAQLTGATAVFTFTVSPVDDPSLTASATGTVVLEFTVTPP